MIPILYDEAISTLGLLVLDKLIELDHHLSPEQEDKLFELIDKYLEPFSHGHKNYN